MAKKEFLLRSVRNFRKDYHTSMKELTSNTLLKEKKKARKLLKKISNNIQGLERFYSRILSELPGELNSFERKELIEIQKEINLSVKIYSKKFLEYSEKLCELMIQYEIRDIRLNQLKEARDKLGFNIGELEKEANKKLISEGKIKKIKDTVDACLTILDMILDPKLKIMFQ